jgi:prepilin-type N-terminal cleavage/methylation domain
MKPVGTISPGRAAMPPPSAGPMSPLLRVGVLSFMRPFTLSPSRGFTLIELLTVIAIIGVLAGILIPVVGMVRQKAHASASVSNLRQIYLALSLFADEHRDRFPKATNTVDWDIEETDPGKMAWTQQLRPYSADQKFFLTPRFEREGSAYFLGARAAYLASGGFAAVHRARIQFPGQFVLAGETNYRFSEPDYDKDDYTQNCIAPDNGTLFADGTQAVLFADGHVRRVKDYEPDKMTFRYDTIGAW